MDFENTNDAPYPPVKIPYKATRIRIPQNDELLAREPRSKLLCTVCPQAGHLFCSGCHVTRYCSTECQKEDRSTHKFFCNSLGNFTDNERPSPLHIRGILFPQNKQKPEWTWVLTGTDHTAIGLQSMYENLPTAGLTQPTPVMYMSCTTSRVPQRWLFSLCLDQETRGEHASSINKSIMKLGPAGHLHTYWGPILVVAGMPQPVNPPDNLHEYPLLARVEDVQMEDISHIIEAVLYGDHDTPCVVNVPRYPYKTLPAIKVNCFGDRARFHPKDPTSDAAIYEPVTISNKEALPVRMRWPSIMAFMLGLPWLCSIPKSTLDLWDEHSPFSDLWKVQNPELGKLNACLLEHGSLLSGLPAPQPLPTQMANIQQNRHPGTHILVHVFGEPILAEHVKVVNLFVKESKVVTDWHIPGIGYKTYNRDVFRKFWEDKKRENDVPGVDLSDVPSPYAWMDKPRQEGKCIKNLSEFEGLLEEAVTDVFFDNAFLGGRTRPTTGRAGWAEDFFDPLA